jgi:NAD(P)-dependent dehydrogenase (short-subunit alcohol dehydrogenase family)
VACTPSGVIEILERSRIPIAGARAVVIGRSDIVGKPMALLLLERDATVTICHSKTRNLAAVAAEADVLVAAVGRAAFVTPDFIKPGAAVIGIISRAAWKLATLTLARDRWQWAIFALMGVVTAWTESEIAALFILCGVAYWLVHAPPAWLRRPSTACLSVALPGVLAGMVLGFAKAIGEFGATITFVSNIPGETQTISSAIYSLIQTPDGDAAAGRLVLISIVIAMGALIASEWFARRATQRLHGN